MTSGSVPCHFICNDINNNRNPRSLPVHRLTQLTPMVTHKMGIATEHMRHRLVIALPTWTSSAQGSWQVDPFVNRKIIILNVGRQLCSTLCVLLSPHLRPVGPDPCLWRAGWLAPSQAGTPQASTTGPGRGGLTYASSPPPTEEGGQGGHQACAGLSAFLSHSPPRSLPQIKAHESHKKAKR